MRRRDEGNDGWEDDSDLDSYDEDDGDFDEEPTIPCPGCRREIHEDSERCPYCERYLSDEEDLPPQKPWWIIVGTVACLYMCYRWIFG